MNDTPQIPPAPPPELNDLLIAEYQYIAQCAFQANEDRARVSNYYFVTAAAAVAAILCAKFEAASPSGIYLGFGALFGVLSLVGLTTVLQLARLRLAWIESAQAMNRIKQYYFERFKDQQPEEAFAWTAASLPKANKPNSVAFLLALSVILVDSVTAAAAAVYLGLALGAGSQAGDWLPWGLAAGLAFAAVQYAWYLRWLK